MDGTVLVALVSVVMLGVLGVLALTKGGHLRLESRTPHRTKKLEIEGGDKDQR
jgi:hypothetical protein